MSLWQVTNKGDVRCRALADKHYTRQKPGSPSFTRPGYNYVLVTPDGGACWVWWRPKWEDGRPGTERKDGLRVIECSLFRREHGPVASELVKEAVEALTWPEAAVALHYDTMGMVDTLITVVGDRETAKRRSKGNRPGHCYRVAGWHDVERDQHRPRTWLATPMPDITGAKRMATKPQLEFWT